MKTIIKSFIFILFAIGIIAVIACSPNTGKNVSDGCGTWSKVKVQDSTEINKGG